MEGLRPLGLLHVLEKQSAPQYERAFTESVCHVHVAPEIKSHPCRMDKTLGFHVAPRGFAQSWEGESDASPHPQLSWPSPGPALGIKGTEGDIFPCSEGAVSSFMCTRTRGSIAGTTRSSTTVVRILRFMILPGSGTTRRQPLGRTERQTVLKRMGATISSGFERRAAWFDGLSMHDCARLFSSLPANECHFKPT